ncbi:hypothetical protein QFZ24_008432 [Streptomyces phaeochromogenes]|jgi:hypothetical protein|uniref:hypothetical protein n=1 Tax=Streptomyces phaeochromogenes TaxID=1923 RepID=UPI002794C3EB|nr:hypothetical protein [Streptomyces phaeochromogenes]MDQ0954509.1 hypothetical protein [Streptomyces phaeochromogenes]
MSHRRTIKEKARAPASLDRFVGQSDFGGMPASMVHRSVEPLATEVAPVALDPHAARLVAASRDAPVRMRDGEELTVEDLNVAKELPQLVQATNDASLAADSHAVVPRGLPGPPGPLHPGTQPPRSEESGTPLVVKEWQPSAT